MVSEKCVDVCGGSGMGLACDCLPESNPQKHEAKPDGLSHLGSRHSLSRASSANGSKCGLALIRRCERVNTPCGRHWPDGFFNKSRSASAAIQQISLTWLQKQGEAWAMRWHALRQEAIAAVSGRSAVVPLLQAGAEVPWSLLTSAARLSTRRPGSLAAPGVLLPNTKA